MHVHTPDFFLFFVFFLREQHIVYIRLVLTEVFRGGGGGHQCLQKIVIISNYTGFAISPDALLNRL